VVELFLTSAKMAQKPLQVEYSMTFNELLALVSSKNPPRVCTDSRLARAGDIFVAVGGTVYDGHDFIGQALTNGAGYVVCQKREAGCRMPSGCETVFVEDSAEAAAALSQASKGNPASKLTNLAVTGTNGKTTVAFLVRS
jgi:UDP-N-acetylmuramoyl-L-alanyl-D-glutamate--2,6-diaminopimelate ligase